jgi:hypothetical protein
MRFRGLFRSQAHYRLSLESAFRVLHNVIGFHVSSEEKRFHED